MTKKIYIFSLSYLDPITGALRIGGVQTYIHDLSLLAQEKGCQVTIFQLESEYDRDITIDGANVIIRNVRFNQIQKFFDKCYESYNTSDSIFIIATDQMPIKSRNKNVITIQHGIAFDIPGYSLHGFWGKNIFLQHFNKLLRCIKNVNRLYWTPNTICVDYNYYNWFRTIGSIYPDKKIRVIPNYSRFCISEEELDAKLLVHSSTKRILFARRFCDYRGTVLFANVVARLLDKYSNVEVTFAGGGNLKDYLIQKFADNQRVTISSFNNKDSIAYHKRYDIAVVPTIYSEGTSLSLLEAMSAGCFPLATHVGGMTNIILDNFNGVLCSPDENSLYNSLVRIIELDNQEFNKIVRNAYYTSITAFSHDLWKCKWSNFMDEIFADIKS